MVVVLRPPHVLFTPPVDPQGSVSRFPTPYFAPLPPPPQAALLVLSAALDTAPQALAPHGPPLAALCRGALAPGVPPGPMAYGLRALGGLAATLGDTQTVSGGGFGARVSPRGRRFLVSPVKSDLEVPQKDHF